jgi:hypothetical protein
MKAFTLDNSDARRAGDRGNRLIGRPRCRSVRVSTLDREREGFDFDDSDAAAGGCQRRYRLVDIFVCRCDEN